MFKLEHIYRKRKQKYEKIVLVVIGNFLYLLPSEKY